MFNSASKQQQTEVHKTNLIAPKQVIISDNYTITIVS